VTREVFQALREHVTALPVRSNKGTPINVNTATLPVLMSLAAAPPSTLGEFINERADKPADSADKFWSDHFVGQDKSSAPAFGISTEYFLLQGEAFIGSSRLALYSVVYRPSANGLPAVLSRSQDLD